jgi:hypothetical protein
VEPIRKLKMIDKFRNAEPIDKITSTFVVLLRENNSRASKESNDGNSTDLQPAMCKFHVEDFSQFRSDF